MPKSKSKSKKQKTHHHHPTTNGTDNLSHEEIWDDSALVRSWNDALAEYEYYHSIHARGEDVDEVLRQAELDEEKARGDRQQVDVSRDGVESNVELDQESADEGEIDDDRNDVGVDDPTRQGPNESMPDADAVRAIGPPLPPLDAAQGGTSVAHAGPDLAAVASAPTQPSTSAPTTATSTTADQTLENIKMAYYWAGYYSGLYDGQRQSQSQVQHQKGQGG